MYIICIAKASINKLERETVPVEQMIQVKMIMKNQFLEQMIKKISHGRIRWKKCRNCGHIHRPRLIAY